MQAPLCDIQPLTPGRLWESGFTGVLSLVAETARDGLGR
jgi:hypothetical protein